MARRGFTVIEVLTVVIIMGILATLAVPPFIRTMDAAKGRLAKTNLKLIYAAEKVYRNEVGRYMPYVPGTRTPTGDEFGKYLGLDIKNDSPGKGFRYEVESSADGTFEARAIYQGARYEGDRITIGDDGTIDTSNWPLP